MMFRATCLAVFTSLSIAGDSGYLPEQLLFNAAHASQPSTLLWSAVQSDNATAKKRLMEHADKTKNIYWLEQLIRVGYSPAALTLSRLKQDPRSKQRLVRLAARGGVAEAQYQYALTRDDFSHRETWLKAAAEQGYFTAQTALADWYLLHQEPSLAEPWLEKTADEDSQSAFQLAYIKWQRGSQDQAFELFKTAAAAGHDRAQQVLTILNDYQPFTPSELLTRVAPPQNTDCKQSIQIFATGLAEMVQADSIYHQFRKDKRLQSLPLCVKKPVWIAQNALSCDANWQGEGRLGCDITPLDPIVRKARFSHAVILAKSGKANVNNGVMYLDVGDTYSVFVHELAHFVGFVDEYPLTTGFAKQYCQRRTAPNLVFLGQITYSPLENIERWESIEFPVTLYPSRTCNNINVSSYKPSDRITFMENHDIKYIPPLYLAIWHERLEDPMIQRPISMNFFQHYESAGQSDKAAYWLKQYRQQRQGDLTVEAELPIDD